MADKHTKGIVGVIALAIAVGVYLNVQKPGLSKVKIPKMLQTSTNVAVQNSLKRIAALVPQPYTNRNPTNLICRMVPYFPNLRFMIMWHTDPVNLPGWESAPDHWVNWTTQEWVNLPVMKDPQRFYYVDEIKHGKSPRLGVGHPSPPDW